MPIIIPETFETLPPLATFDISVSIEAGGDVALGLRASLASRVELQASPSVAFSGAASLASEIDLTATGRLNDEANVFGAASLASRVDLQASGGLTGENLISFDARIDLQATATIELAEEISFAFVVNVRKAAVATALARNVRRFDARLRVNSSTLVPVKSASIKAPPDTLGTELSVELARADLSQIPLTGTFDFEFGVWTGAAFLYETVIRGARLAGRSKRIVNEAETLPADTVSVSFVDVIGDRWNLAPSGVNLLYYDPQKVKPPSLSVGAYATALPRTGEGGAIQTNAVATPGLSLYFALSAAYVTGCGFDSVKTNVPDFPVEQVNFTVTGGYDGGVRGLLTPFAPVVFAIGNVLWIIDPDSALPAGLAPKPLAVSRLVEITSTMPAREPVDGVLVTIKGGASGDYYTERLEVEHSESGTFGTESFTQTDTQRKVREYRTFAQPTVVRREVVSELKTTVLDWQDNIISRETQTDNFDTLNRKVGHLKKNENLMPDVTAGGALMLQTVSTERQSIFYGAHPLKPDVDTILKVETVLEGLILSDSDSTYLGKPFKLPLTDAHRAGLIDPNANQAAAFGALKTTFEFLRVRGDSVEMETRVINHVTNAPDSAKVTVRPGADELDRNSQATEEILLTVPGTIQKRRVASFDGSGLPSDVALRLCARLLRKLMNPPLEFAGSLAYPDSALRRGRVLAVSGRAAAALGLYIATGFEWTFQREAGALTVRATLTARMLTTDTVEPFRL